jgi:cytochrome b561
MAIVWRNAADSWGAVAKSFHWLLALLILGQLVLGQIAEQARLSPLKLDLFVWHKSFGVTILLLVMLPAWETNLARTGHILLYVLMCVVPLTGWWVSDTSRIPFKAFWLVPVPDLMQADKAMSELAADVHGILTKLLLLVVVIHIAAAVRHHFFLHNQILTRMLPWRSDTR